MNKKQTYAAPKVDQVVIFPREAVLDATSPITLSALLIDGDPAVPAVENADFSSNVDW